MAHIAHQRTRTANLREDFGTLRKDKDAISRIRGKLASETLHYETWHRVEPFGMSRRYLSVRVVFRLGCRMTTPAE